MSADAAALPPFKKLPYKGPDIEVTRGANGVVYLRSRTPMGNAPRTIPHALDERAAAHPDRPWLKQRAPNHGPWRQVTYGEGARITRSLAQELAPHGITVNTVSPGHIAGAGARTPPPDVLQQLAAATPVRRLGRPEEVASLCNWLASDDAAFMTGVDFPVNGGALTGR